VIKPARLKKQITIRINEDAIAYFKGISEEVGIPYQSLIDPNAIIHP